MNYFNFKATLYDSSSGNTGVEFDGNTAKITDYTDYFKTKGVIPIQSNSGDNFVYLASDAPGGDPNYYDYCTIYIEIIPGSSGVEYNVAAGGFDPSSKKLTLTQSIVSNVTIGMNYVISPSGLIFTTFDSNCFRQAELVDPDGNIYNGNYSGVDYFNQVPQQMSIPVVKTDGIWEAKLYTVPSFDISKPYYKGHCVYYQGEFFEADLTMPNGGFTPTPGTTTATWKLLPSKDDVGNIYKYSTYFVEIEDIIKGFVQAVYKARCGADTPCDVEKIISSFDYKKVQVLELLINSIEYLVNKEDWDLIKHDINYAKTLLAYNE